MKHYVNSIENVSDDDNDVIQYFEYKNSTRREMVLDRHDS